MESGNRSGTKAVVNNAGAKVKAQSLKNFFGGGAKSSAQKAKKPKKNKSIMNFFGKKA
jgi:paraquat-inducible protein B